ncbi:MAG: PcfJ domain-containing protein [bacterium]|nr:PcfJ domain-containing protein [bacterium]
MEQADYTKTAPTQPPEGFMEWFRQKIADVDNYLVYRAARYKEPLTGESKKMVECTCTSCTERSLMAYIKTPSCAGAYPPAPFGFFNEVTAEQVISGDDTICPVCGEPVKAIHVSNIGNGGRIIGEYYPMTIERHSGRLMLIGWSVRSFLYKTGIKQTYVKPYEAYIAEERKIVKLTGYNTGWYGAKVLFNGWKQLKRYGDTWRGISADYIYPWNPEILIGTSAENCKLDVYLKSIEKKYEAYPVTYLNLWIKKKNVENLIMTGAGKLINSMISGYCGPYYVNSMRTIANTQGIDWKKVKPHEMTGLTKSDYKEAVRSKWDRRELEYYKQVEQHGIKPQMLRKTMAIISERTIEDIEPFESDFSRIYRYIIRQRGKYQDMIPEPSVYILADYWRMADERRYDLNDMNVRYPQNLARSHDTLASEIKYEQDKEKERLFIERFNELYKFSYCTDNFEIHPARSPEEMVHEGKVLHHCVGSYTDKHAQGKTAIFFIRKRNMPDKPYYTLELDVKTLTVRQNRGRGNCARTNEVKAFESEWLEHIKEPQRNRSDYNE